MIESKRLHIHKDDQVPFGSDDSHDCEDSTSDTDDQDYPYRSGEVNLSHINPMLYLLGLSYHPKHDYTLIRDDESKHLIWFTYRTEFEEIAPYGIKSDAGWGCMFRASQMLLCQALKLHYCSRTWTWPRSFPQRRKDTLVKSLLTWFADFPSVSLWNEGPDLNTSDVIKKVKYGRHSWYSLHNMVAVGMAKYEVLPGEWLGPQTACYIIRDLCERHYNIWNLLRRQLGQGEDKSKREHDERNGVKGNHVSNSLDLPISTSSSGAPTKRVPSISNKPPPRVYVAQEGCIYRPLVEELMTKESTQQSLPSSSFVGNTNMSEAVPVLTLVDTQHKDNTISPSCTRDKQQRTKTTVDPLTQLLSATDDCLNNEGTPFEPKEIAKTSCPWDTSVILLVPLRLGLKTFNSDSYSYSLASTFQLPQSLGFVGGSPRHALWFYGAVSDGSKLFGLDPHTVHSAPNCFFPTPPHSNFEDTDPVECHVELNDEYLRSVQCPTPSPLDFSKIDPSLALGFYCRDRDDFISFCETITQINKASTGARLPELFSISDLNPPDYTLDVSLAISDMLSDDLSPNTNDNMLNTITKPVDEEEYVLL